MPIDFYENNCQSDTTANIFGLFDKEGDATPARLSFDQNEKWNATVINDNGVEVTFTAIDHCIVNCRPNGDMESSCDCMLTYRGHIIFVELKSQRGDWISDGIEQ